MSLVGSAIRQQRGRRVQMTDTDVFQPVPAPIQSPVRVRVPVSQKILPDSAQTIPGTVRFLDFESTGAAFYLPSEIFVRQRAAIPGFPRLSYKSTSFRINSRLSGEFRSRFSVTRISELNRINS
jgi:hypothetical protein